MTFKNSRGKEVSVSHLTVFNPTCTFRGSKSSETKGPQALRSPVSKMELCGGGTSHIPSAGLADCQPLKLVCRDAEHFKFQENVDCRE